jgi:TolB protein
MSGDAGYRAVALVIAVVTTACGVTDGTSPATSKTTGAIRVTVSMTGVELPFMYAVRAETQTVVAERAAAAVLKEVMPGLQRVQLQLPSNCKAAGENPRSVTVVAGQTATVSFDVTCTSTIGTVRLTAPTTGVDLDADGYTVRMTGLNQMGARYDRTEAVVANGAPTVLTLPVGSASLTLRGIALNCDATGANPRTIAVQPSNAVDVEFAVDCGSKGQLAYVNYGPDRDIFLVNDDRSDVRRLTATPAREEDPSWSPDGSKIAFTSDRDGNPEIYTMNADGSGVVRLTNEPRADYQPAWSPDGRKIAFVSNRTGDPQIFVMNADGTDPLRLTTSVGADDEPAWSPDGQRIAFTTSRHGDPEIYVMNADGSAAGRLTFEGGKQPAWAPDGVRIAYSAPYCDYYYYNCYPAVFIRTGALVTHPVAFGAGERPRWSPDGRSIAYSGFDCDYYYTKCVEGAFRIARVDDDSQVLVISAGYAPTWRPR